jgi:hypothetical protein
MADKRDLKNFDKYEKDQEVSNSKLHAFPVVFSETKNGRRKWQIFVRLIKNPVMNSKMGWDTSEEEAVKIKKKYYLPGEKIPEGIVAQYWSEGGLIGKTISRYAPSYISKVTNKGRENERNVFQNALVKARAKFIKAVRERSSDSTMKSSIKGEVLTGTNVYFPMLANQGKKDFDELVIYPAYVQPKLDGVRRLATIDSETDQLKFYSRGAREFPVHEKVKESLEQLLLEFGESYEEQPILDGEFYQHGKSLQAIGSIASTGGLLIFHIFDVFFPSRTVDTKTKDARSVGDARSRGKDPFADRVHYLVAINKIIKAQKIDFVKVVTTKLIRDKTEMEKFYINRIRRGFEGIMIRNTRGIYLTSHGSSGDKLRSKNVIKKKETFVDEFPIVDYTSGTQGENVHAIVWIGETEEGNRFNVVQKGVSIDKRKEDLKLAREDFDTLFKGKLMRVEYAGMSDDKIPLQGHATIIPFDETTQ